MCVINFFVHLQLIEVKEPETQKCIVATPDEKPKVKEIKDKENKLNGKYFYFVQKKKKK